MHRRPYEQTMGHFHCLFIRQTARCLTAGYDTNHTDNISATLSAVSNFNTRFLEGFRFYRTIGPYFAPFEFIFGTHQLYSGPNTSPGFIRVYRNNFEFLVMILAPSLRIWTRILQRFRRVFAEGQSCFGNCCFALCVL